MESQIFAKAITPFTFGIIPYKFNGESNICESYELQILCANYYNNVKQLYVSEIFTPTIF